MSSAKSDRMPLQTSAMSIWASGHRFMSPLIGRVQEQAQPVLHRWDQITGRILPSRCSFVSESGTAMWIQKRQGPGKEKKGPGTAKRE